MFYLLTHPLAGILILAQILAAISNAHQTPYWIINVHLLGLGLGCPAQAHDEAAMMEGPSALDGVLFMRVRDLHLCATLPVVDHVALHNVSVQTLH